MSNVRIGVPGAIGVGDALLKETTVGVGVSSGDPWTATRPEPRVWNPPGRSGTTSRSERVHVERGLQVSDRY